MCGGVNRRPLSLDAIKHGVSRLSASIARDVRAWQETYPNRSCPSKSVMSLLFFPMQPMLLGAWCRSAASGGARLYGRPNSFRSSTAPSSPLISTTIFGGFFVSVSRM